MKIIVKCKTCDKEISLLPFKVKEDGNLCFQCKLKLAWNKRLEGKKRSTDKVKVSCKKCNKPLGKNGNGIFRFTIKEDGNYCLSCINRYFRTYKPHTKESKLKMSNNSSRKLNSGEASINRAITHTKNSARKRGLEYNISRDSFIKITSSDCFYCGSKPNNICKSTAKIDSGSYIYNGIDRIDSDNGYILDNCVPCCRTCNWAKGTKNTNDFNEWKNKIVFYSLVNEQNNFN